MSGSDAHIPHQAPAPARSTKQAGRWRRFVAAIPLRFALLTTGAVWAMGCVWSFREQSLFAQTKGFHLPWLLPAVIDGLAIALGCVAYAASLDGRPGLVARLGTAVAVAASATSNATFAWQRSGDLTTVVIAAGVPVAANLAFEVLLHELRRQVMRRRGLPAPVALPYPRLIRVLLAPVSTLREWRRLVLDLTALEPAFRASNAAADAGSPDALASVRNVSVSAAASDDQLVDAPEAARPVDALASAVTLPAAAPAKETVRLASLDAVTAQVRSVGTRQVLPSLARQYDTADARPDADAGTTADADPDACTGADASAGVTRRPDGGPSPQRRPAADAEHDASAVDAGTRAEAARQLYRASLAAGDPMTGRELGRRYDRSPSWGRERIAEVKSQDRTRILPDSGEPAGPVGGGRLKEAAQGGDTRALRAAA
jgi:hypothetical protein